MTAFFSVVSAAWLAAVIYAGGALALSGLEGALTRLLIP